MASRGFIRYFDLGFFHEQPADAPDVAPSRRDGLGSTAKLPLGGQKREVSPWAWTIGAWLSMSVGVFLRQGILLKQMDWDVTRLNLGSATASAVVGLALLPPAMRWLNARRTTPAASQLLTAFSIGFLVDVASVATIRHLL